MSLYVDASALLKRYVWESNSADCDHILRSDVNWITARHSWVEVIRNLYRLLEAEERASQENAFHADWRRMNVVELDRHTCERAAELAKTHGVRTLDALHLAAAQRVGGAAPRFVTYDVRQAHDALLLGFTVLGN